MKKIKKTIKFIFLFCTGVSLFALLFCVGYYYSVTYSVKLEPEKLENLELCKLEIFDRNGKKIVPSSQAYIAEDKLQPYTKNAFICAEDKRFYSHHGIDYMRVAKALISNIKTKSFSQGASTISQQLIKNTQLSSEKTVSRKLKEFKLTKKLEKTYSKSKIIEMYLNNIYFGNGCYGIQNAAKHYFDKSASQLTIAESALLAGTINAPSIYDIESNQNKAVERRNLILKLMKDQSKISEKEYNAAIAEPVKLNLTKLSNNNFLFNEIIEEACKHLQKSENELKNSKLKIYTYYDQDFSAKIAEDIEKNYSADEKINVSTLVVDNSNCGIMCAIGSKGLRANHQPGSTIKPILVYAPAIEKGIISPATKLLDEKIDISGYTPENADKKFHGYVSVREALKNSYNIPAVKVLNEVGISDAQNFASRLGINFSLKDNNLATALGGFTDGVKLDSLCAAYTSFANGGKFKKPQFISKIVKNDSILYQNNKDFVQVMKPSTAYLITNMLTETSKSGTAKRLRIFDYEIASKTGTVGMPTSTKNLEAYNISYTSGHTILSYFGGTEMDEKINGATYPTLLTKDILENLYPNSSPLGFVMPESVTNKAISKSDYKNNIISLTDNPADSQYELFDKDNLPRTKKYENSLKMEVFNFENKKPIISFIAPPEIKFHIIRKKDDEQEIIFSSSSNKYEIIKFEDISAKSGQIYEYFVEFCGKSTDIPCRTNSVKLRSF